MDYAQQVRQQQNENCGNGYRWSEREGRCIPDPFNLGGHFNTNIIDWSDTFASRKTESSINEENDIATSKRPVWQVVIGIVLIIVLGYTIYHFMKTGKIKIPKKISFKRPVAPSIKVTGGEWGGIGIQ